MLNPNKISLNRISDISISSPLSFTANNHFFISYSQSYLKILNLINSSYKSFKYENINYLLIYHDFLFICTSDIYILDLNNFNILKILKFNNVGINNIKIFNNTILISKNDIILYYNIDFNTFNITLLKSINFNLIPNKIYNNKYFIGYKNNDEIKIFDIKNNKEYFLLISDVLDIFYYNNNIYYLYDNLIKNIKNDQIIEINFNKEITFANFFDKFLYFTDQCNIYTFNLLNNEILKLNINNIDIDYFNKYYIKCKDNDIIFNNNNNNNLDINNNNNLDINNNNKDTNINNNKDNNNKDTNINNNKDTHINNNNLFFPNNLTSVVQYKDFFIISTDNGKLKIIKKNFLQNFIFGNYYLINSCITFLKIIKNYLFLSTEEGSIKAFEIKEEIDLKLNLIYDFNINKTILNFDIYFININLFILILSTSDNKVYFIKNKEIIKEMSFHDDTINSLEIYKNYLITGSNDKTLKIHKMNIENNNEIKINTGEYNENKKLKNLVLNIKNIDLIKNINLNEKLLSGRFFGNYLLINTMKTFKIFNLTDFQLIKNFSVKKPVLNSFYFKNNKKDYFFTISDLVRIYDKNRYLFFNEEKLNNCWNIIIENIEDDDLVNKNLFLFCKDKIITIKICNEEIKEKSDKLKLVFNNFKNKEDLLKVDIGLLLIKNGHLKNLKSFNQILNENYLKVNKKYHSDILKILEKQYETIENFYDQINSLDFYE